MIHAYEQLHVIDSRLVLVYCRDMEKTTLLTKVDTLVEDGHTKKEIVLLCGYYTTTKSGHVKLNFNEFDCDLMAVRYQLLTSKLLHLHNQTAHHVPTPNSF